PPAKGLPPLAVWHAMQLPSAASCAPCAMLCAGAGVADGVSGGSGGWLGIDNAALQNTRAISTIARTIVFFIWGLLIIIAHDVLDHVYAKSAVPLFRRVDERIGIGFGKIDALAFYARITARQDSEYGFRTAVRHPAVGRIHLQRIFQGLDIRVLV